MADEPEDDLQIFSPDILTLYIMGGRAMQDMRETTKAIAIAVAPEAAEEGNNAYLRRVTDTMVMSGCAIH